MLEEIFFLITALLGFVTILLIGFRFNLKLKNNLYFILALLLNSCRFLGHGLPEIFPSIHFQKPLDFLFFMYFWPLMYLYFGRLRDNHVHQIRKEIFNLLIPSVIALFYLTFNSSNKDGVLLVHKIAFLITMIFNAIYAIASYRLLSRVIWQRNSEIKAIEQQNIVIKKWTKVLFITFTILLVHFYINLALNKSGRWHINEDHFLWVAALIWIILYSVILISPEFLYGYDIFQNKFNKFKKNTVVFESIWITKSTREINVQDAALKEKIKDSIANYFEQIEKVAMNSDLFLNENFNINDLAKQLDCPTSHIMYLFKFHSAISFSDFKKIIRIHKAILLIEEGFLKTNTFESLAAQTGFASYSTFFKSFKSIVGVSPQDHISN